MFLKNFRSIAFILLVTVSIWASACQTPIGAEIHGRVSEMSIRQKATKTVTPVFPDGALRQGVSGVGVAQIEIDTRGRPNNIEVLEAPSKSIGQSLMAALSHWHFKRSEVLGRPAVIKGKITYYYLIHDGRGIVLTPGEAVAKHVHLWR